MTHAAHAVKALRARFPFFHANSRERITAILLSIGIGSRVLVNLGLGRQRAVCGQSGRTRALCVIWTRRALVVERARGEQRALQRARTGPLRERVCFTVRACAIEADGLR